MRVYLAGAIGGLNWETASQWRNGAREYLARYDIQCLNPLDGKEDLSQLSGLERQQQFNPQELILRDLRDIGRSDVVLVELVHADVTYVGTLMEIMYAWEQKIPIIAWTGNNSLHLRSWLPGMITRSYECLAEALDYIVNYWNV